MDYFGELLRKSRTDAGLTQKELAEKVDIDASSVSKMEKGIFLPVRKVAVGLADTLGIFDRMRRLYFFLSAYVAGIEDVQNIKLVEVEDDKSGQAIILGTPAQQLPSAAAIDGAVFQQILTQLQQLTSTTAQLTTQVAQLTAKLEELQQRVVGADKPSSQQYLGETQKVKNVIKVVGKESVKSALEQFMSEPRYELYPYWGTNADAASQWDGVITKEELKKGNLYLVMKGFPSITVPTTQYLYQIEPLLKMEQWKALIENTIKQRQKRYEAFISQLESEKFEFRHIMPMSAVDWYKKEKYPSPDSWARLLGGNEATPQQIAQHLLTIVELMEHSKGKYQVGLLEHHHADEVKLYDNVHWEVKVGHAVLIENFLTEKEQDLRIQEPSIVEACERFFMKEMWAKLTINNQTTVKEWLISKAYEIDPTRATRQTIRV
jgi:transcriptional regulator with XRE-family HTH domain